jgi:hypothetical protein
LDRKKRNLYLNLPKKNNLKFPPFKIGINQIIRLENQKKTSMSNAGDKMYTSQDDLLLMKLLSFYVLEENIQKLLAIITGQSCISLRIVDWFATNYAKKFFTIYNNGVEKRFKVYTDYKLKLKAYSKKRFDPFCRWDRITLPYKNDKFIETTIGQLNFFKWVIENNILDYIEANYDDIEKDMNARNSTSKRRHHPPSSTSSTDSDFSLSSTSTSTSTSTFDATTNNNNNKTRKKREELSISAAKGIKKESGEILISFS